MQIVAALVVASLVSTSNFAERLSPRDKAAALAWIAGMKINRRGPFSGVAWYCKDGIVLEPHSYACTEHGGGFQYGVLSAESQKLAEMGIHVGTILTAMRPQDLIRNDYYRARAYIIESYLERALKGWTLEAARNYRGFRQVEDEREASRWLLIELAKREDLLGARRSLILRLIRAMPYGQYGSLADEIRTLAGLIGDADHDFAQLRFKIHAMPEPADVKDVAAYCAGKSGELKEMGLQLIDEMRRYYDADSRKARLQDVEKWVRDPGCKAAIQEFLEVDPQNALEVVTEGGKLIALATTLLKPGVTTKEGERNLLLLHVMSVVEELWVGVTAPLSRMEMTRAQALNTVGALIRSAGDLGLLAPRELTTAEKALSLAGSGRADAYGAGINGATHVLDWARARLLADVGIPLTRYEAVEPQARGVIDDILRSGVMLPLAAILDRLTADVEKLRGGGHRIEGVPAIHGTEGVSFLRGENPGLAAGPLAVRGAGSDPTRLKRTDIVLLQELPPELPPVAGIITVGGAGSLSHVALLARNLSIPHASVGGDLAVELAKLAGTDFMLGVSAGRRVAMGPLDVFAEAVRKNFDKPKIADQPFLEINEKILDLETTRIYPLSEVSPADSGRRFGPKASELGRLRKLFPDRVSDAAVIPFGAFLRHVSQPSLDGGPSPIALLRTAYANAKGKPADEIEATLLTQLALFRESIAKLPFPEGFEAEVDAALAKLGEPGTFGVFIRSDTNVEDLKKFTGAGLNETVPNRTRRASIFAAIRKVWASPFSQRSFRWRQRILKNPEMVFPSVLLHRTVPSEVSGVMVTTDLVGRSTESLTVSASEGVSAVVDGGSPETIVIDRDGSARLLASSRSATRKLIPEPPAEGVVMAPSTGRDPLLGEAEIKELLALATEVKQRIPAKDGLPWDMEFGFSRGKAYLLQIRPLRTSRSATTQPFLVALDQASELSADQLDFGEAVP